MTFRARTLYETPLPLKNGYNGYKWLKASFEHESVRKPKTLDERIETFVTVSTFAETVTNVLILHFRQRTTIPA